MGIDTSKLNGGLGRRIFEQLAREGARSLTPPVFVALPQPATRKRSSPKNATNDGRPWQNEVLRIARAYRDLGVMKLEKADAPNKFFGGKVVPMANPFPDFVGCWHRSGRMIAVEAKSTTDHRLRIDCKGGGLTTKQGELLRDWKRAGAISGILWRCGESARWVETSLVAAALDRGARSLAFEEQGDELSKGLGFVTFDFAAIWVRLKY